jgi:hypothetical protein
MKPIRALRPAMPKSMGAAVVVAASTVAAMAGSDSGMHTWGGEKDHGGIDCECGRARGIEANCIILLGK